MKTTYINYEAKERDCLNCFEVKPFSSFTENRLGNPQSYCKKCSYLMSKTRMFRIKLDAFPQFYKECPDCEEIYKIALGHNCEGDF